MTEVTTNPNQAQGQENAAATDGEPKQIHNYTDGYTYEVPRPFLTLSQAAGVLGMTLRSLERSLIGKWGNKLPDGWLARRMRTHEGEQWRILPPPGFRVKVNAPGTSGDSEDDFEPSASNEVAQTVQPQFSNPLSASADAMTYYTNNAPKRKAQPWRPERHTLDQPSIVIDRGEEVEHLLRELVSTKGALAEERRVHLDDMRMISQMQSSLRLLEVNAAEQIKIKQELQAAKDELEQWKSKYTQLIKQPWWRRVFSKEL